MRRLRMWSSPSGGPFVTAAIVTAIILLATSIRIGAEFPSPVCTSGSAYAAQMQKAREDFLPALLIRRVEALERA